MLFRHLPGTAKPFIRVAICGRRGKSTSCVPVPGTTTAFWRERMARSLGIKSSGISKRKGDAPRFNCSIARPLTNCYTAPEQASHLRPNETDHPRRRLVRRSSPKSRYAAAVGYRAWMLFMAAEWMGQDRSQWNSRITMSTVSQRGSFSRCLWHRQPRSGLRFDDPFRGCPALGGQER